MKIKEITTEDATGGATSAGAIAVAPVSSPAEPYSVGKQKKKKKKKKTEDIIRR